ncbi:MAG: hypothetical protein LC776_09485 [Acidobacteria bacterium]|nr:hypothetical protein [Acidobacteriota bacterium]
MAKQKSDRELIDTGTDKRFVRRDDEGRFKESEDVGRSLAQDRRQAAKQEELSGNDHSERAHGERHILSSSSRSAIANRRAARGSIYW